MAEKKKFFEVELPIINQKAELLASSEKQLIGRTVKIDLTRKLRGKSLEIIFKITGEEGKLEPEPYRLHLLSYYIRRMMRKSVSYVENSFSAQCKDAKLRVKIFLITRKKVSRAVRKALRNQAKEEAEKMINGRKYDEVFSEILSNKIQKALSLKLKKIYPLSLCEIRDIIAEKSKGKVKEEK